VRIQSFPWSRSQKSGHVHSATSAVQRTSPRDEEAGRLGRGRFGTNALRSFVIILGS